MNHVSENETLNALKDSMAKQLKIIEVLEDEFKQSCKLSNTTNEEHASLMQQIHSLDYIVDLFNYEVRKRGN